MRNRLASRAGRQAAAFVLASGALAATACVAAGARLPELAIAAIAILLFGQGVVLYFVVDRRLRRVASAVRNVEQYVHHQRGRASQKEHQLLEAARASNERLADLDARTKRVKAHLDVVVRKFSLSPDSAPTASNASDPAVNMHLVELALMLNEQIDALRQELAHVDPRRNAESPSIRESGPK